jgi:hypothetical protein
VIGSSKEGKLPSAEEVVMAKGIVDDIDGLFRTVQTFTDVYH